MRIVFVHQDHCLYGASRSLLALVEQLVKRGHECFVLVPRDGPLREALETRRVEYAITPWRGWMSPDRFSRPRRWMSAMKGFMLNMSYVRGAAGACERFKPDLVHTNSSRTAFGSLLARRLHVPHTWHFREFLGGEFSVGAEFSLGQTASCVWIRRSTSAVVLVSDVLRQQFSGEFARLPAYVVHNGVMSLGEMQKAVTPLPETGTLTLALVGRFDRWKQPLVALEAVRLLTERGLDVRLLMAGDGLDEDVRAVREFVESHRMGGRVEVLGFVDDVSGLFARSHALLMPSRGDAFGRVTAESMAYGRPVVAADSGANTELIADGVNGLLFRTGDPEDLAAKIRRLIEDRQLLTEMSRHAAETAREKFTTEKYGEAMEKIFLSVVRGMPGTGGSVMQ